MKGFNNYNPFLCLKSKVAQLPDFIRVAPFGMIMDVIGISPDAALYYASFPGMGRGVIVGPEVTKCPFSQYNLSKAS